MRLPAGRLVVIESPYKAHRELELQRNLAYSRALMRFVTLRGDSPLASHLDITQALFDTDHAEREAGIVAGLQRLRVADIHLFGLDLGMSDGMRRASLHTPSRCSVEQVSLPEWKLAADRAQVHGDYDAFSDLIAANQPRWHIHE